MEDTEVVDNGSDCCGGGGGNAINHQGSIYSQGTGGTWGREGEDGVVAGGIFDGAAIEGQGVGGELIKIAAGVSGLNDVAEGEGIGAATAEIGGNTINSAGFQLQRGGAACGGNEHHF